MSVRTVIEAIHDLNSLELTRTKIDENVLSYISTVIFPRATYKIDEKVENAMGLPVLGITCLRGYRDCRTVVTVIDIENTKQNLDLETLSKIKQVTAKIAESEMCCGAVLTLTKKIDREMLSTTQRVDSLVNEYSTYDYALTFV